MRMRTMACLEVLRGRGRVEGRKVEQNGSLYLVWMFLKLIKEKRVINIFFYLDILKIRKERRGND